jgi:hypothetical protein
MANTKSGPAPQKEWLVVHHESKSGFRRLIIQHLIEPAFMAEVTAKGNEQYQVEVFPEVSDGILKLAKNIQNHWSNKVIDQFKSLAENQFNPMS